MLTAINPTTEKPYGRLRETSLPQLKQIITAAHEQKTWSSLFPQERANVVRPLVKILEEYKESLATTMAGEIGKPIKAGRHEVEIAIKRVSDFCDQIPNFLKPEIVFESVQEKNERS